MEKDRKTMKYSRIVMRGGGVFLSFKVFNIFFISHMQVHQSNKVDIDIIIIMKSMYYVL